MGGGRCRAVISSLNKPFGGRDYVGMGKPYMATGEKGAPDFWGLIVNPEIDLAEKCFWLEHY